ncbi:aminoglycoside phosphotransferase family protein [Pseudactinotalea terrae]|uniref:aminoglycoside phosphotransferase family protein n=1 Tax=Pseudactinotalea terrae TaxID=1743262 RepID=UPI0012E18154|nr:aminoglycoside phosphotransferase family protein [Pseudactinotalea terrae]
MSRVRLAWSALPDHVRGEIEDRLGSAVVDVLSHEGGYSPGMAATLSTADGGRTFVKAVSASFHRRSWELYRDEARVNAMLPDAAPAPRMLWSLDDGEWVANGFEAADEPVDLPWDERTLEEVLAVYDVLAGIEGPAGLPTVPHELGLMTGWHTALADGSDLSSWDPWVAANLRDLERLSRNYGSRAAGTALVHLDARRDNMVRRGGRVLLVDWPYAAVGAPWVDLLAQLPSITLEGGGDPADLWARAGISKDVAEDDVTTVLAGLTGYFVHGSVQPPPPGVPHVRQFQRAQGEIGLAWLRQRLGE